MSEPKKPSDSPDAPATRPLLVRETRNGPLSPPIVLSSVFRVGDLDEHERIYKGKEDGFIYARDGHPNAAELGRRLAVREGAESGLVVSSGMGAIAACLCHFLKPGDRVVASRGVYGQTSIILRHWFTKWNVTVDFFDDIGQAAALLQSPAQLVFAETLSNPLLRATPIDELAAHARGAGGMFVVDATFTPAPMLRPLDLGADLVIHSLTKIISGHSDVTLGAILGRVEILQGLPRTASTFGWHASAMDSWLTLRGLETLDLRLERSARTAAELAGWLAANKNIRQVIYPGLPTHPDHAWMTARTGGYGTMISFKIHGGREDVNTFFRSLELIPFAPSLGDVRTTVSHPASTSHAGLSSAERASLGIDDGLIRMSVGLEPLERLTGDLGPALAKMMSANH